MNFGKFITTSAKQLFRHFGSAKEANIAYGSAASSLDDAFVTNPSYYNQYSNLLSSIERSCEVFTDHCSVVELNCGGAKTYGYFNIRDVQYIGFDPSPILIEQARRTVDNPNHRFTVLHEDTLTKSSNSSADVVLALFEPGNWSVIMMRRFVRDGAELLKSGGALVLSTPLPYSELKEAAWDIEHELENAGFSLSSLRYIDNAKAGQYALVTRRSS